MKDQAVSWLRLEEPAPTAETAAVLDATKARLGYVRNSQRAVATKPRVLVAMEALSDAVNRDPEAALSPREREMIALVVSVENGCEACVFSHAAALRKHTGDPLLVAMIEVSWRRAALTARERALAAYAEKLTRSPREVEEPDLATLRAAGLNETAILEAASITAYFNMTNRLNSGIGVTANAEAYAAHR
jgi:uncharacterized peroxidase-related enzyme